MIAILPWIIPPLVGAIIGYVTNAIAIKMLFRPLKEVRILGIRLPFTPGILPRERHKLAESIGRMVERELITPEILKERFSRQDTKEALGLSISAYTARLLALPPADWDAKISGLAREGAEIVYPKAARGIIGLLNRNDIKLALENQGRRLVASTIDKLNPFQRFFVSAGQFDSTLKEKMPVIIEDLILQLEALLDSPEAKAKILKTMEEEIQSFPAKNANANLKKLLDFDTGKKSRLDAFLAEKILSTATEQIDSLLKTINVRTLVSDRIDSLDMLQVERIVLDVMAGQLKWINVFGGILGALIGGIQVLLAQVI
ncbi:DUF445 domain-containing protein [Leadbettera azotonutricia]|uniref:YheB n=1 Tax=Leadbettera azotonutricia (strain ATCC BAA-888 / DSM 13862 / ZAS-9) TaxID=545695 RepID=F5YAZ1_LEAAZ|nr:DUF445 family protein [Leadbettera azotonutricia]AEF82773.1 YheB [Leadbettera azotonutricia ZAS-9]